MSHLKSFAPVQSQLLGTTNQKDFETEEVKGRPFPRRRECPICFCTLISPVYQCYNGHLICEPCLVQVSKDKCPVCREKYPQNRRIRAREFEEIMRECTADCHYAGFGCAAVLHYEEILEHESACRFRRLRCPGVDRPCGHHVEDGQFIQHLEQVHSLDGLRQCVEGDEIEICQNFDFSQATTNSSIKTGAHFLRFENHTFFVRTHVGSDDVKDGEFVQWAVTSGQGDGKDYAGFKAVIKLVFCSTAGEPMIQTKWSGPVTPNKHNMMAETAADRSKFLWVSMTQLNFYGHGGWKLFVKIVVNDENEKVKFQKLQTCQKLHSTSVLQSVTASGHQLKSMMVSDSSSMRPVKIGRAAIAHLRVSCDECYSCPIKGIRYKCKECADFDLCESCFREGFHAGHLFYKILQSNVMAGGDDVQDDNHQEVNGWQCQECQAFNNAGDSFCVACGDLKYNFAAYNNT